MKFADLWAASFLAPLFILWAVAWLFVHIGRPELLRPASLRYPDTSRLEGLRSSWVVRLRPFVKMLRLAVVALLMVAILRPQTGHSHSRVRTEGVDIFLVIDTSGSMAARDFDSHRSIEKRRTRLKVVKDVVEDFVAQRTTDQVGLVAFGTEAFTQCPLTLDTDMVSRLLNDVDIGVAGDSTAVGNALAIAVKRLEQSKAKSKVAILLTDGRNNAGAVSPTTAAEIAKALGVRVYTIGAGGQGEAPILVDGPFGQQVQRIEADLDEDTLQRIADITGGAYFRAEDAAGLAAVYNQIDAMERTEIETLEFSKWDEQYPWFVLPALILLLLELLLLGTRLAKVP